uniref:Uncharacterized protein n=1 Tax=Anguilla anguilla TaxID=7936 RepID=A0A0E9X4T3_ANGAN
MVLPWFPFIVRSGCVNKLPPSDWSQFGQETGKGKKGKPEKPAQPAPNTDFPFTVHISIRQNFRADLGRIHICIFKYM